MFLDLFSDTESFKPVKPAKPARSARTSRDPDEPHIFSVSDITRSVRSLIEGKLGQVWVQGEICNHRRQASGHQYFGLKDERALLSCVLFQRAAPRCRVQLTDGMLVQVRGDMTVYEPRGQYQLNVNLVQAAGIGLLQAKFEALKRKLEAEGLFAVARKRALPKFPAVIGIVTSPTGAAIRDMLNVLHRRAPSVRVIIHPARVQGDGAAAEIATAVEELNRMHQRGELELDAIVVCRGGGSAEDLWAFNEEILARAIFASVLPVVSAVGHEIDFTISDFVADLRAATPSAAAELLVPEAAELSRWLLQHANRLQRETMNCMLQWRSRVSAAARSQIFREPQRRIAEARQKLDHSGEALLRGITDAVDEQKNRLAKLRARLQEHRPECAINTHRCDVRILEQRLSCAGQQGLESCRGRLLRASDMLRALSPQNVLARGYTISTTESGAVITDPDRVRPGEVMITATTKGKIRSVVN
jgi:exodeoxyribonuclease VII large subunit